MKKNINKIIITLVVIMISFFAKLEIFKALPTCNIGSKINEPSGYGYAYTTVDANGRSGVSSGQINICKNMDCSGTTTLTGGWVNWSEGERNFFVEYDSGPGTKITEVEYTLYYEAKNGDAEVLCKGTPAVDISNNNGVVHIDFSIKNGSVLKIEANESTTPTSGAAAGTKKGKARDEVIKTNESGEIINSSATSCTEVSGLIHDYWKYVMIIVPILLIVMITIDFFKALAKGDSDSIKKAGNNTIKRAISAVVLLALPALLGLIFSWFGLDLCV